MKTHKEQNTINPRKSLYRIVLQIFVWGLIIAFVSTLGVMWDGTSGGFPVILGSSKGKIDLSPQNFYMMEYNRLNEELQKNNPNIDPRILTRYIQQASLTNTENAFARQLFYQDINLLPSAKTFREIQANTGLSSNLINFQYAENYYLNPVGVLPVLASPTVSDMYAISDLQKLTIALEILTLNKTNFLYANLSEKEKTQHYLNTFEQWIDTIVIQEIKTLNRGQARRVVNLINKNGVEDALAELASDTNITIQKDIIVTTENFSYFNDILMAYKTNTHPITVAGPLYKQGEYSVALLSNITDFSQLPMNTQQEIGLDYLQKNYQQIAKQYYAEWNNTLTRFQEEISTNTSFSVVVNSISGVINHNTLPFNLLNTTVTNVFGELINLPILTNPEILNGILNTPLSEISSLIHPQSDLYVFVRPLLRQYRQDENPNNIYEDPELFQNIFYYKNTTLKDSLNSQIVKKYYKIKTYPDVLSNLSGY
ncbi:MAG: hypothetical protein ACRC0X_02370 [Brevinema sp.]